MEKKPPIKLIVTLVIVALCVPILLFNLPFGTVGVGERGVQTRMNAITGKVFGEGLYFRVPLVERIVKIDVRIQKDEVHAGAASKDLQTVDSTIALNYHIIPEDVIKIYQEVGKSYNERIIAPAIQQAVKASTAKFTAEELITKRSEVRDTIKGLLKERLEPRGISVDELNIVNFDFSASFNQAIEGKVTAEQNALAAKNKLEQIKFEAEQRVTQAKGEAEAIRIQAQAITSQGGEDYVRLQAIAKWSGILPVTMLGEAIPFINITK